MAGSHGVTRREKVPPNSTYDLARKRLAMLTDE